MTYTEHHIDSTTSMFVELPGINELHTFSLNYIYLGCLNIVRNKK